MADFVAIGEPGESYPDFGATRAYFEGGDHAWQLAVLDWVDRAAIVIFIPGMTAGLGWELDQVFRGQYAKKLVMVFPADRAKARRTRMSATSRLCTDPEWRRAFENDPPSELLAVFSTQNGEIVRVMCKQPREEEFTVALHLAALAIFGELHIG